MMQELRWLAVTQLFRLKQLAHFLVFRKRKPTDKFRLQVQVGGLQLEGLRVWSGSWVPGKTEPQLARTTPQASLPQTAGLVAASGLVAAALAATMARAGR